MKKTFVKNLILLLLLNVIIKPLWILGIEVNVQRILGPEVYGNYFALLNFAFLFTVLMDFGLNSFNNRRVSRNPQRMPEYLARGGLLKCLLGVLFIVVMQCIASVVGFDSDQRSLLWMIGAMIFLQGFLLFVRSNISGIQWYRADVLISVVDRSLSILMAVILIWGWIDGLALTIERFVILQIIAYGVTILIGLILLRRRGAAWVLGMDLRSLFDDLRHSLKYALLVLLVMSYFKIDGVMIERMLSDGARQAGIYAQGYKLLEASIMVAYLFSTLLLPMFSNMIKKNEELAPLVRLSDGLLMVPVSILAIGVAVFREEIMTFLYLEETVQSAEIFHLLMLSLIPISATYIYGTLITAKGDLALLNKIAFAAVIINIIGNYVVIPDYGIKGAAWMTLITQSFAGLAQVGMAHRMFRLQVRWAQVVRSLVFVGLLGLVAIGLHKLMPWQYAILLFALIGIVLSMLLKLFSPMEIKTLMSMRDEVSD